MIHLDLSAGERRTLARTLHSHHSMRIRVRTLNLDGEYQDDLTGLVTDGQVTIDATADVTRTASLTLLDEKGTLDFDSDSPSEVAMYLDRMIKIHYGVRCEFDDGPRWVDIPIFTGPITSLSRTGAEVSVEAQGKEAFALGAVWRPLTIQAKRSVVSAIRIIMRERGGETRFNFNPLPATLPKKLSIGREGVPWHRAKSLARSLGERQLFYNGDGICVLRRLPARPVFTFDANTILSPVAVSYSTESTVNCVFVKGGVPDNGKVRIAAEIFPPRNHRLSPWRLGRHNSQGDLVPRYLMEVVEDENIRSVKAARRIAREHLRQGLAQSVEASFDALPIPMLEEHDMVRAVTDEGTVTFRLTSFAMSLTPGDVMTIGYTRNLRTGRLGQARHLRTRTRTPEYWREMAAYKARKKRQAAAKEPAKTTTHKKNAAQPRKHRTAARR